MFKNKICQHGGPGYTGAFASTVVVPCCCRVHAGAAVFTPGLPCWHLGVSASTGVYFPNTVATQYIPAETRYTPAWTRQSYGREWYIMNWTLGLYRHLPCSTGVCRVAAGVYRVAAVVYRAGAGVYRIHPGLCHIGTESTPCWRRVDAVFYRVHAGVIVIFNRRDDRRSNFRPSMKLRTF